LSCGISFVWRYVVACVFVQHAYGTGPEIRVSGNPTLYIKPMLAVGTEPRVLTEEIAVADLHVV